MRVSLKYCGSCNPLINLSQIGNLLKEAIEKEDGLKLIPSEDANIDTMVILCGCPRACGNKGKIRAGATLSIVVAGETIDTVPVMEKDICAAIIKKLTQKQDS